MKFLQPRLRYALLRRQRLLALFVLFVLINALLILTIESWWPAVLPTLAPLPLPTRLSCRLPRLLENSSELARFFERPPPLRCDGEERWTVGERERFQIDAATVARRGEIHCDVTPFWRADDDDVRLADSRSSDLADGAALPADFFKASCKAADGTEREEIGATVVPRRDVLERTRDAGRPVDWAGLGVYMLGFDSISHMTFRRKMPVTLRLLTEEMEGVVLNGYNIVGDGTPQAFLPILTGRTEEELPLTRKRLKKAQSLDVYPMIWQEFSKAGFVTLFGEDMAKVSMFNYRLKGFKKQPTDHYMRPFFIAFEEQVSKHEPNCIGGEPQHIVFLRYAEHFFDAYTNTPKFAVHFHGSLSHDDINLVELADEDTAAHLLRLRDGGHLNKTLLLVMSDHGHRFAKFRGTQQGQLEERLPFFAFVAPRWWREGAGKSAWENLRRNADRLTTPFDIHATLQRLLHWQAPSVGNSSVRAMSLWDAVPEERTCAQAGIDAHWCACLQWQAVPSMLTARAHAAARAVVAAINEETRRERRLCAPLQLARVDSALVLAPHDRLLRYRGTLDLDGFEADLGGRTKATRVTFQLRFWTAPGDAHYEATVVSDPLTPHSPVDLGVVSHINQYGNAPHCVIDRDYFLAKWCVCYDMVSTPTP